MAGPQRIDSTVRQDAGEIGVHASPAQDEVSMIYESDDKRAIRVSEARARALVTWRPRNHESRVGPARRNAAVLSEVLSVNVCTLK